MSRQLLRLLCRCLAILAVSGGFEVAVSAGSGLVAVPAGFQMLFNGEDLEGWWGAGTEDPRSYLHLTDEALQAKREASLDDIRRHWKVEGGELVSDGEGLYLTTDQFYGDFELLAEYKTIPRTDSGIYLRGCPQVQIWDSTEQSKFALGSARGSGGLWNNSEDAPGKYPLVKADKPFGEWNRLRVIMVGSRVWVWLNDKPTVDGARLENYFDRTQPVPPRGPIQLQTHGGEIRWRNLFLRKIAGDEANRFLRGDDSAGFQSVFNGRDLTGWAGPVENYEVRDGALVCKPGKGGTIFTEAQYTNYVVRLEFKLPPGGNNGLAIRYPGSGDAAYVGMCECQVLDNEALKYANLDPRQYHGSAYGMVPAHRGYLRAVGEWNFEEVTVYGSSVKVELNGTVILDADLAEVTRFLGDKPHPGKDRTFGHFGFAGHSDPVMFRQISIKTLD